MFKPYGEHVLIRKIKEEEKKDTYIEGGLIVMPDVSKEPKQKCQGYVVAVGSKCADEITVGARVTYRKYAEQQSPPVEGMEDCYLMTQGDLLGEWDKWESYATEVIEPMYKQTIADDPSLVEEFEAYREEY